MWINKIQGLCTAAQSEATKNKAHVRIQHIWLWFHLLRSSILMVWSIWSSCILKIISPLQRLHHEKIPVVLLMACFNPLHFSDVQNVNRGNSFIETFQKSKDWFSICWNISMEHLHWNTFILLEWFNPPVVIPGFPPSHGFRWSSAPGQAESHLFSPERIFRGFGGPSTRLTPENWWKMMVMDHV